MSRKPSQDPRGQTLVTIARQAVEEALGEGRLDHLDDSWLQQPSSTFVTITLNGQLRGCIGSIAPTRSLFEDVRHNAIAASFQDHRFPTLTASELAEVKFEVSILSPMQRLEIRDEADLLDALEPGTHGLMIQWRDHRATFLPQVWEQLPEKAEFLTHLKRKAGLGDEFWARDLEAWMYTVEKYVED